MSPRPARPTPPAPRQGPPKALVAGVLAAVVLLVVVVVLALTRPWEDDGPAGAAGEQPGVTVSADAAAAGAPEVVVYEDFQCPWCALFDQATGEELHELAESGDIRLTYVIRNFLDGADQASTRAANAALCAGEQDGFLPFHEALYATHPVHQQSQGHETGWTDEHFVAVAEQVGVADLDEFTACVAGLDHVEQVDAMEERSVADGVTGTPRVHVDGEPLGDEVMSGLLGGTVGVEQAITEAAS